MEQEWRQFLIMHFHSQRKHFTSALRWETGLPQASVPLLLLSTWRVMMVKTIISELQGPESTYQKISNEVLQHSLQPRIWKVQFSHFQKSYITCKHNVDFYFTNEKCSHLVIFLMLVLLVIKAGWQTLPVHCIYIYPKKSGPTWLGQGLRSNVFIHSGGHFGPESKPDIMLRRGLRATTWVYPTG